MPISHLPVFRSGLVALVISISISMMPHSAEAAEKGGVEFPETVQVGDKNLVLNGIGIRRKFFVKAYVAALYLEKKEQNADAILNSSESKKLWMKFTYDVDRKKVVEAWNDGYTNNCIECERTREDFNKLIAAMTDMKKKDEMAFTVFPDRIEIRIKDSLLSFKSPTFNRNLLAILIGPKPSDSGLKKGLLGED